MIEVCASLTAAGRLADAERMGQRALKLARKLGHDTHQEARARWRVHVIVTQHRWRSA